MGQIVWKSAILLLFVPASGLPVWAAYDVTAPYGDSGDGTVGGASDQLSIFVDLGTKLVGTQWGGTGPDNPAHQDTISNVNNVITEFNGVFDPNLTLTTQMIGKFNFSDGIGFVLESGPAGFEWYYGFNGMGFDSTGNPTSEQRVVGFKWVGAVGSDGFIDYYVAKADAGQGGFSVWTYMPGMINLFYVDADGDINLNNDGKIVVDPRGDNAISHISFYGDTTFNEQGGVVPEPTSLALAGFAGIGMAVGAIRRRRQSKTDAA